MPELRSQDAKALSLAAMTAAAGLGLLALRLGPDLFRPWPAAFLVLLTAGVAGALSCWATGGKAYGFPLSVILLPFIRLLLLYLKHGSPPWSFGHRLLLLGDGFPWWAAASVLASLYAGSLSSYWARVTLSLERIREIPIYDRSTLAVTARLAAAEAGRLYLVTFLLVALVLTLIGKGGEGIAAVFCLLAFFIAGITFAGLIQARTMMAVWHADGAAIAGGSEERWLAGHWRWLLPPFVLLPLFPWLGRPFPLADVLNFLAHLSLRPGAMQEKTVAVPSLLQRMPTLRLPGLLGRILLGCLLTLYTVIIALAVFVAAALCFLALRYLFFLVRGWFIGLPPLLLAIREFLAAILSFFRRTVAARIAFRRSPFGTSRARREAAIRRSRVTWPPTPVRRLFARLVLWGRTQGLPLPPILAPAEIARRLSTLVPEGREEDLAFLAEVYRRERYGGERLDRRTRLLYRRAWERIIRSKATKTAPPEGGRT